MKVITQTLLPIVLLSYSCTVQTLAEPTPVVENETTEPEIQVVTDSTELRSTMQSSKEAIVISHIVIEGGDLKLNLTKDEAIRLGIEEDIYQKYYDYVQAQN